MSLNKILLLLGILILWACDAKENAYKQLNQDIAFQYVQFGEGKQAEIGDYLATSFLVEDFKGDTLHHVPNYPYIFPLENSAFDTAWTFCREGDSGVFRMPRKEFNQKFDFYQLSSVDTGEIKVYFRLNKVLAKNEAAKFRQALLSKRELEEQLALKQYMAQLEGYVDTVGDVIRQVKRINHDGLLIEKGDEISIAYQGSFLNGYVFEDSRDKAVIPSFIYGKEYQLLEGIHMGISGLKSGESVKIILPSRRAFGKEGSLAGIVPPYTAVIFDVNILKVEKHQ